MYRISAGLTLFTAMAGMEFMLMIFQFHFELFIKLKIFRFSENSSYNIPALVSIDLKQIIFKLELGKKVFLLQTVGAWVAQWVKP